MERMKLAAGILAALLVAVVVGAPNGAAADVGAFPSRSDEQHHGGHALAQALPNWQQVNSNGFGDQLTGEVSALEAFNGYLYAGTVNASAGARIFRSPDGVTWAPVTEPGFGIAHDIAPPAILDLTVFNGRLYASTGRGDGPGQIWRTLDGVHWAPMVITGFSNPDTVDISVLAVYNGVLYAGAKNLLTGAQIWRSFSGDNNTWTQVAPAVPGTGPAGVTGMAVFDGALYAAVESAGPAQIWYTYGGAWTAVVDDGFGDSSVKATGGMAEFGGFLYVGAGSTANGAQIWRTGDGATWQQVIAPGFSDPNNRKVDLVLVFQNQLYASANNTQSGVELWRATNGTVWERANLDGFGDSNNTGLNGSNSATSFFEQLYVGTSNNADGGELWRVESMPVYGVVLSPDQAQQAMAGQAMTYTLTVTNTSNVGETIDLVATGNQWTTTLSSQAVALAPGSSQDVTVEILVPPAAAAADHDQVSIQATCRHDTSKHASVVLTTVSAGQPGKLYLPVVTTTNIRPD